MGVSTVLHMDVIYIPLRRSILWQSRTHSAPPPGRKRGCKTGSRCVYLTFYTCWSRFYAFFMLFKKTMFNSSSGSSSSGSSLSYSLRPRTDRPAPSPVNRGAERRRIAKCQLRAAKRAAKRAQNVLRIAEDDAREARRLLEEARDNVRAALTEVRRQARRPY